MRRFWSRKIELVLSFNCRPLRLTPKRITTPLLNYSSMWKDIGAQEDNSPNSDPDTDYFSIVHRRWNAVEQERWRGADAARGNFYELRAYTYTHGAAHGGGIIRDLTGWCPSVARLGRRIFLSPIPVGCAHLPCWQMLQQIPVLCCQIGFGGQASLGNWRRRAGLGL